MSVLLPKSVIADFVESDGTITRLMRVTQAEYDAAVLTPPAEHFTTAYAVGDDGEPITWYIGGRPPVSAAYFGAGTIVYASGSSASSIAVPYPAGLQVGDLVIMGVASKPSSFTLTTPTGWTSAGGAGGGIAGATDGADTGTPQMRMYSREIQLGDSGSVAVPYAPGSGTGVFWGQMLAFRKTGGVWSVANTGGIKTTGGTPFTAAMGSDPGLIAGDLVAVFAAIATDIGAGNMFSNSSLTGPGITTTLTEVSEPFSALDDDIGGLVVRGTVDAGPSTGAPTFSADAAGTTTNVAGPIRLVRVRAAAA